VGVRAIEGSLGSGTGRRGVPVKDNSRFPAGMTERKARAGVWASVVSLPSQKARWMGRKGVLLVRAKGKSRFFDSGRCGDLRSG
jgi:hypothetical protein